MDFLKNILENFETQSRWDILWSPLPSCSSCFLLFFVFLLSESFLFFWFLLFLPSLSPRKGLKNLLLQATQVDWKMFCCLGHSVYYVRCVEEARWYSTEAYLVLVNMALQWDIQTKSNSCKTWTVLIDWTAGLHKGKELADNQKDRCTCTHSNLVLLTKVTDLNPESWLQCCFSELFVTKFSCPLLSWSHLVYVHLRCVVLTVLLSQYYCGWYT